MMELPPESAPREASRSPSQSSPSVPWTVRDTWLGVAMVIPFVGLVLSAMSLVQQSSLQTALGLPIAELALILPMLAILRRRKAGLLSLGFRRFSLNSLAIGCGTVVVAYAVTTVHNLVLQHFGIPTQASQVIQLARRPGAPIGLMLGGILIGPIAEEVLFRGFLFQGLRQAYGALRAGIISALVFSVFHMDLSTLLPMFLLGGALAYVFQKANSIWPGVVLHILINASSIVFLLYVLQNPSALP